MKNMNIEELKRQLKIAEGQLSNSRVAWKGAKSDRARKVAQMVGEKAKARIAELKAQLEAMAPVQEQPVEAVKKQEAAPVVMDPAALELQKACDEKLKKLIEAYKAEEEALKQKYAQKKADVYAWFDAAVKALKEQPAKKVEEVKEELPEKKDNKPQTSAPVVESEDDGLKLEKGETFSVGDKHYKVKEGEFDYDNLILTNWHDGSEAVHQVVQKAIESGVLMETSNVTAKEQEKTTEPVSEEVSVPQKEVTGKVKELFVSAGNFREKIAAVEDPFLVSVVMPIVDDVDVINACAEAMMACYEKGIKSIEYQFPSFEVMEAINDCVNQLIHGAQKHDMSCSFAYAGEEAESVPDVPEEALKDNPWMGAPVEEVVGDEPVYEAAASILGAPEFTEEGENTEGAGYHCRYFDGCAATGSIAV